MMKMTVKGLENKEAAKKLAMEVDILHTDLSSPTSKTTDIYIAAKDILIVEKKPENVNDAINFNNKSRSTHLTLMPSLFYITKLVHIMYFPAKFRYRIHCLRMV